MLLLGIPFALMIPDFLDWIPGILYYVINSLSTLIVVFIIWRMTDFLSGVQKTGYYWKENGRTVLSYDGQTEILDSATELFLSDRHVFSRGINLLIRNRGKKIEFLSESLEADTTIHTTAFYRLFSQVLDENLQLTAEEDVFGEKTDYWYKKKE